MKHTLKTLYCPICGGTHVQIIAWVDANTNQYCSDVNTPLEKEDTWCEDCEDYTGLFSLSELWEEFQKVPKDDNGCIEESFLYFAVGTHKSEVEGWFNVRCPNGLEYDLRSK